MAASLPRSSSPPPYSPDLNPIEQVFARLKSHSTQGSSTHHRDRRTGDRTRLALVLNPANTPITSGTQDYASRQQGSGVVFEMKPRSSAGVDRSLCKTSNRYRDQRRAAGPAFSGRTPSPGSWCVIGGTIFDGAADIRRGLRPWRRRLGHSIGRQLAPLLVHEGCERLLL